MLSEACRILGGSPAAMGCRPTSASFLMHHSLDDSVQHLPSLQVRVPTGQLRLRKADGIGVQGVLKSGWELHAWGGLCLRLTCRVHGLADAVPQPDRFVADKSIKFHFAGRPGYHDPYLMYSQGVRQAVQLLNNTPGGGGSLGGGLDQPMDAAETEARSLARTGSCMHVPNRDPMSYSACQIGPKLSY
jgi:hypothetical protein